MFILRSGETGNEARVAGGLVVKMLHYASRGPGFRPQLAAKIRFSSRRTQPPQNLNRKLFFRGDIKLWVFSTP